MTNKEKAIELVKEMVKHGWKLVGSQTVESVAEYYQYDVEFFEKILESVKSWR